MPALAAVLLLALLPSAGRACTGMAAYWIVWAKNCPGSYGQSGCTATYYEDWLYNPVGGGCYYSGNQTDCIAIGATYGRIIVETYACNLWGNDCGYLLYSNEADGYFASYDTIPC